MAYRDPAAQRAYQRAWHARRKGKKPGKAWKPGAIGRPPKGARAMMPVCSLPGGKMRESHVYDEDGLCDCGARRMEFAPRPELRPEVIKVRTATASSSAQSTATRPRPEPPAPRPLPLPTVAKARPVAPRPLPPKAEPWEVRPELLIAGQPVGAIVAELEGRREVLARAIAALRELAGSPA